MYAVGLLLVLLYNRSIYWLIGCMTSNISRKISNHG